MTRLRGAGTRHKSTTTSSSLMMEDSEFTAQGAESSSHGTDMGPPALLGFERDRDALTVQLRSSKSEGSPDHSDIAGIGDQFSTPDKRPTDILDLNANDSALFDFARLRPRTRHFSDTATSDEPRSRHQRTSVSNLPLLPTPASTVYDDVSSLRTSSVQFEDYSQFRIPASNVPSIRSYNYPRSDAGTFYTARSELGEQYMRSEFDERNRPSPTDDDSLSESIPHEQAVDMPGLVRSRSISSRDDDPREQFFDSPESLPPELRGPPRSGKTFFRRLRVILNRAIRPHVPSHSARIIWTCACGEELYMDVPDTNPQAVQELSDALNNNSTSSHRRSPMGAGTLSTPAAAYTRPSYDTSMPSYEASQYSTYHAGNHSFANGQVQSTLIPAYLELCINTGQSCQSLGEVDVTRTTSDTALWKQIREKYRQVRAWRIKKHFLLKPTAISFVSFGLTRRRKVHIFEDGSIPPPKEVANLNWHYHPCPPDLGPLPMPSHAFIHYLTQCDVESDPFAKSVWLGRLPKKLHEPLYRSSEDLQTAWGIHIIEGPDMLRIMWTIFCLLALFIGPLLAYTILKKDVQGATGIVSVFLSILTLVATVLLFFQQKEG